MNPERLVGSIYARRSPAGDPFDRVRVMGLITGDVSMGIADELSVQPVEFGPICATTVEALAAAYSLESEGPGYVPEIIREATHRAADASVWDTADEGSA